MNIKFGIISYLGQSEKERQLRTSAIEKLFNTLYENWPEIPLFIIAQEWGDYRPNCKNKIEIKHFNKLGIAGARKKLREEILATDCDYLITLDDDTLLDIKGDPNQLYDILAANPNGFSFQRDDNPTLDLPYAAGPFLFALISRFILEKVDFMNINPENNEGWEDIIYAALYHYKYPEHEFIYPDWIRHNDYPNVISTWVNGNYNLYELSKNTKKILFYIAENKAAPDIEYIKKTKSCAYATFLTNDDYIYCILGLYASWLQTESKYPFVCAVGSRVSDLVKRLLSNVGIKLIDLPPTELPRAMALNNARLGQIDAFNEAASKFGMFALPYDKIIYLDGDTIILKNIDHLFSCKHMTGVRDGDSGYDGDDFDFAGDRWYHYFNAGMLVIEPSGTLAQELYHFMQYLPLDRRWSDQNILAAYYRNWPNRYDLHLPWNYNMLISFYPNYKAMPFFKIEDVYIIHFVAGAKPTPKAWKTYKLEINNIPIRQLVRGYFAMIDEFIIDNKNQGKLPQNFLLASELVNEKYADDNQKLFDKAQ